MTRGARHPPAVGGWEELFESLQGRDLVHNNQVLCSYAGSVLSQWLSRETLIMY